MNILKYLPQAIGAGTVSLLCFSAFAADEGVFIPRIDTELSLADFAGMTPRTELARSLTKVEGFIQRQPDDGELSSQHTEAYVGYDETNLYAIWLAFDTEPELIRANLSSRENRAAKTRRT